MQSGSPQTDGTLYKLMRGNVVRYGLQLEVSPCNGLGYCLPRISLQFVWILARVKFTSGPKLFVPSLREF